MTMWISDFFSIYMWRSSSLLAFTNVLSLSKNVIQIHFQKYIRFICYDILVITTENLTELQYHLEVTGNIFHI